MPEIDVNDWIKNTEYTSGYERDDPVIQVEYGMVYISTSCFPPPVFNILPVFPGCSCFVEMRHSETGLNLPKCNFHNVVIFVSAY